MVVSFVGMIIPDGEKANCEIVDRLGMVMLLLF